MRTYRASRYIKEYYETQDNLTDELFDKKIITYSSIGQVLGVSGTIIRNAITKETKNPQPNVRRGLDIFFNKDFYEELGKYSGVSEECKKECQHPYWVNVLRCGVHSK